MGGLKAGCAAQDSCSRAGRRNGRLNCKSSFRLRPRFHPSRKRPRPPPLLHPRRRRPHRSPKRPPRPLPSPRRRRPSLRLHPRRTPAPVAQAPAPASVADAPTPEPAPAPTAEAQVAAEPVPQTPTSVTAAPTARVAQEPVPEFAPESIAQLTGAWAYSRADCDKLFQRRGKALAYRQPVDKFAQAAIVEPQRMPSATCQIDRASNDSGALKVSGDCQDSVSYTSRTVYVKLRSNNQLAYSPTGDGLVETTLMRCPL